MTGDRALRVTMKELVYTVVSHEWSEVVGEWQTTYIYLDKCRMQDQWRSADKLLPWNWFRNGSQTYEIMQPTKITEKVAHRLEEELQVSMWSINKSNLVSLKISAYATDNVQRWLTDQYWQRTVSSDGMSTRPIRWGILTIFLINSSDLRACHLLFLLIEWTNAPIESVSRSAQKHYKSSCNNNVYCSW